MSSTSTVQTTLAESSELLIDSNLLLLLIVGSFESSLLGRWKRLNMFTLEDFDCIRKLVATCRTLLVTPHVLTEVSNLANSLPHWQKAEWSDYFRRWILEGLQERQIRAIDVVQHDAFSYFGITDAALFHLSDNIYVVTLDAKLAAYPESHHHRVINFNHFRTWLLP